MKKIISKKKIIFSIFLTLLTTFFGLFIFIVIFFTILFGSIGGAYNNVDGKNNISETSDLDGGMLSESINGFKPILKSFTITAVAWYYPPNFGGGWHPGLDLATPSGNPVYAPANSIVLFTGNGMGYGNYVVLMHEIDGVVYTTLYGHLTSYQVSKGEKVASGKAFARVGSTGNSTGPHVHLEIFKHSSSKEKVLQNYKNQGVYFGLGYNNIGNCSNVCRLAPQKVYNYQYGKYYSNKIG